MKAPDNLWTMTTRIFLQIRPSVHRHLGGWVRRAEGIPDPELRRQALASIRTKTFHCEGGSILALLAGPRWEAIVPFVVAYQTISDYLDNLCDRSTSLDPTDFRALHAAMLHALTPHAPLEPYYRFRDEQDDGGYLQALVTTCQEVLQTVPHYPAIAPSLLSLARLYCDLQVYKHMEASARAPRLQAWFETHRGGLPEMAWYEFAASTGSTLGIFCLVARAAQPDCSPSLIRAMHGAYFPWIQGLHILLDYLIDQEEDRAGGDLNFCFYYPDEATLRQRLLFFFREGEAAVSPLPDAPFHRMIHRGLLGMYLSDRKVDRQADVRRIARALLRSGGAVSLFFHLHCWIYRRARFARQGVS